MESRTTIDTKGMGFALKKIVSQKLFRKKVSSSKVLCEGGFDGDSKRETLSKGSAPEFGYTDLSTERQVHRKKRDDSLGTEEYNTGKSSSASISSANEEGDEGVVVVNDTMLNGDVNMWGRPAGGTHPKRHNSNTIRFSTQTPAEVQNLRTGVQLRGFGPGASTSTNSASGEKGTARGSKGYGHYASGAEAEDAAQTGSSSSLLKRGRVRPGMWQWGPFIAKGSFGAVYEGLNTVTGEFMAIKVLPIPECDRHVWEIYQEVCLMRRFDHQNIIHYLGAELSEEQGLLFIFQELVRGGSVAGLLSDFGSFSEAMTRRYTRQVLCGLEYLHAHNVVHSDIKGSNILVNELGVVKLADFGASQAMDPSIFALEDDDGGPVREVKDGVTTMNGTPFFMAPEILLRKKHGLPVDLWALGGAVIQMVTGNPPWYSMNISTPSMLRSIMVNNEGKPPPLPQRISPSLRAFLLRCFCWNPSERPTAAEAARDPFLLERDMEDSEEDAIAGRMEGGETLPEKADRDQNVAIKQNLSEITFATFRAASIKQRSRSLDHHGLLDLHTPINSHTRQSSSATRPEPFVRRSSDLEVYIKGKGSTHLKASLRRHAMERQAQSGFGPSFGGDNSAGCDSRSQLPRYCGHYWGRDTDTTINVEGVDFRKFSASPLKTTLEDVAVEGSREALSPSHANAKLTDVEDGGSLKGFNPYSGRVPLKQLQAQGGSASRLLSPLTSHSPSGRRRRRARRSPNQQQFFDDWGEKADGKYEDSDDADGAGVNGDGDGSVDSSRERFTNCSVSHTPETGKQEQSSHKSSENRRRAVSAPGHEEASGEFAIPKAPQSGCAIAEKSGGALVKKKKKGTRYRMASSFMTAPAVDARDNGNGSSAEHLETS